QRLNFALRFLRVPHFGMRPPRPRHQTGLNLIQEQLERGHVIPIGAKRYASVGNEPPEFRFDHPPMTALGWPYVPPRRRSHRIHQAFVPLLSSEDRAQSPGPPWISIRV